MSCSARPNGSRCWCLLVGLLLLWALGPGTGHASPAPDQKVAPVTVGYLKVADSPEHKAARAWLRGNERFRARSLSFPVDAGALREVDVLWVHLPDSASYLRWQKLASAPEKLREYYEEGGRLLLTNFAARIPHAMGIETARPETRIENVRNREHNDKKGYQSFRGHPVLSRGLHGGDNIFDATRDYRVPRTGYFGEDAPAAGKVAAVERARNSVRINNKLLIEYSDRTGRALAAGAYIYLDRPNNLRVKLERFLENSLLYLTGALEAQNMPGRTPDEVLKTYWTRAANVPQRVSVGTAALSPAPHRSLDDASRTELLLTRDHPTNEFWDLAGRRAIVMGYENGGIAEVWTHPFKLLFDYQTGLVSADSVIWLDQLPLRVEVRPESFTRIYETPRGPLRQVIYPSLHGAGAVAHYEAQQPVRLVIRFRSDLKYAWPYPKNVLGNVYFGYDEALNSLHVRNASGDFYSLMGADVEPVETLSGGYGSITWNDGAFQSTPTEKNQVYHAALYSLDEANDYTINYAFVGTNEGKTAALEDYRSMLGQPRATLDELVRHYSTLLDKRVTLDTPNDTLDRLFKWALVGTDRFAIRTPHLGTALMAGYGTSNPDGGTWASSTPGYAWYFGRDGEWAGLAVDAYGDFELVRNQLELLQRFQDLQGKIFHALNTAGPGVQQYNAADATPLYIVLAGHYLRASGDVAFIRESWPHLKAAMDFLYASDTDGDGLIENTNVGHGWIELGELNDAHTTFYLAGTWAQALEDASYMARELGKTALGRRYAEDADHVRRALNSDFWNADDAFFYQAINQDGSLNDAHTMLAAVPMYFGELDADKALGVLDRFGSNAFSTDWGMRIIDQYSPLYNPESYHLGTVWPLFTGWTALAEYQYGRPVNGFTHIMNSLLIKGDWALGYVEEVLNGEIYAPDGFCPHQAWSETSVLHPAIEGMVGWKPDAPNGSVTLQPRFPLHWPSVTVRNLRIGDTRVRLQMQRSPRRTTYRLTRTDGAAVDVRLMPALPAGQVITEARVDGAPVEVSSARTRGLLAEPVVFRLRDEARIVLRHTGGAGAVPVVAHPEPGERSQGYRVVSASLDGSVFRLELEGRADTEHLFRVNIFDQELADVEGASVVGAPERGLVGLRVPFDAAQDRYAQKTVTLRLQAAD